jgi:uncharacterized protein YbcI
MPEPTPALTGDELLAAVATSMIALHERHYHRVPLGAKVQLIDGELLSCVLSGVYTEVEQALIEHERGEFVRQARATIQCVLRETFTAEVRRLSGREVDAFVSTNHIDPDLEIELFWLAPSVVT